MAYFGFIVWGALTAVLIGFCTPLALLGEMGGPKNFTAPFIIIIGVMLALIAYASPVRGGVRGVVSGLLFALPIFVVCYGIPHSNATIAKDHGGEFRLVGVLALVVSSSVLGLVAVSQKKS